MRKHSRSRFFIGLLAITLGSALTVLYLAGCSKPGDGGSSAEFVGTWQTIVPPSGPTITIKITETTFSMLVDSGGGDTETVSGTVTSFDESANHILMLVVTESFTGTPPAVPVVPGTKFYILYDLSGTTLTMALDNTAYPVDLSSAYTFTKQ